jgi:hypothetical protein
MSLLIDYLLRESAEQDPRVEELLGQVAMLRASQPLDRLAWAEAYAELDRLGRRVLERVRLREEMKAIGVPLHSVREGGEVSDLEATILAGVAEDEIARLGERVSASKQH